MKNKSKKFNPILLVPVIIAVIACLAITHLVIMQHEQKIVNQTIKSMYPDAKKMLEKRFLNTTEICHLNQAD